MQTENKLGPDNESSLWLRTDLIGTVISSSALREARNSLILWGVINLGAWYIFGSSYRSLLSNLRNPGADIYLLAYSGAIIGGLMLSFALFGIVTKRPITIFLNGLSLVGVGLWNIFGDLFANATLMPYGYTIVSVGSPVVWIVLGLAQVYWGARSIAQYTKKRHEISKAETPEVKQAKEKLKDLVKANPSLETGVLELTVSRAKYMAKLTNEQAICVKKNLGDFFVIKKRAIYEWNWKTPNIIQTIDQTGRKREVAFAKESLEIFKTWSPSFPEVYGEPTILSSVCTTTMIMKVKFLLLTRSKLIIRTPDGSERDTVIPLDSITKVETSKQLGEKILKVNTIQTEHRMYYLSNLEEWRAKLS